MAGIPLLQIDRTANLDDAVMDQLLAFPANHCGCFKVKAGRMKGMDVEARR
jgi:hypothetical protein